MSSGNPLLTDKALSNLQTYPRPATAHFTMGSAIAKTGVLFAFLAIVGMAVGFHCADLLRNAAVTVVQQEGHINNLSSIPSEVFNFLFGGLMIGFVLALIIIFFKTAAPFLSIPYAIAEGCCLGAFTAIFERMYPGIAWQAAGLSGGVFLVIWILYATGAVRATPAFVRGLLAATLAIVAVYLIDIVAQVFFSVEVPILHETGWGGILVSLLICAVAAFNFVIDFNFFEEAAESRAPKYLEWYAGFGLMVTFVWLYIEILKLLAKVKK